MKRKLTVLVALLLLCFSLNISAFATENTIKYISDELDVLNSQEENALNAYAGYLAGKTGVDFIFVTTDQIEDIAEYVLTLSLGKSENKIVMVMNDEYWDLVLTGTALSAISVAQEDALGEAFIAEDYYDTAVATYMKEAASMFWPDNGSQIADYQAVSVPTGYSLRLVDNADLLNNKEEATLLAKLDEISERQQADIVVVTADTLGGKTPMDYADDFYDYNGYGFGENNDGVLLLVSMEDRDWWMSTSGYGITAITDAGIEYISDKFLSDLSDGKYAEAFSSYADLCDEFFTQAKAGKPYDVGHMPKEPFNFAWCLAVALLIGYVVAAVVTGSMKRQLKTVRFQSAANSYVKANSMNVSESRDLFLYTQITRHEKPKETSSSGGSTTHTSSSGGTHGGGGGKF